MFSPHFIVKATESQKKKCPTFLPTLECIWGRVRIAEKEKQEKAEINHQTVCLAESREEGKAPLTLIVHTSKTVALSVLWEYKAR